MTCEMEQFKTQTRLCEPCVTCVEVALLKIKGLKIFKLIVKRTLCIKLNTCILAPMFLLFIFCFVFHSISV